MLRALLCTACSLALLAGCSGGDDGADSVSTPPTLGAIDGAADAGSSPAVTVAPVGGTQPTSDSVDLPVAPVGTDDVPIVPVDTADVPIVPTDSSDIAVVDDPLVAAVDAITPAEVCTLAPRAELETIVGMSLTQPIELDFNDLGAVCSYVEDLGGTSATVASIELSTIDFALQIDPSAETVSECTVGGHTAWCQDTFSDSAMRVDATVVVALGDDSQPAMVVTSSVGLDAAVEIAELALSNLAL